MERSGPISISSFKTVVQNLWNKRPPQELLPGQVVKFTNVVVRDFHCKNNLNSTDQTEIEVYCSYFYEVVSITGN